MGRVLHASYSGWFPNCLATSRILAYFPFSMSLEQAMEIYWRVKKWNITISSTLTSGNNVYPFNYSFPSVQIGQSVSTTGQINGIIPEKEEFLVCNPGGSWGGSLYPLGDTIFLAITGGGVIGLGTLNIRHQPLGYFLENMFYPRFQGWEISYIGGSVYVFPYSLSGLPGYESYINFGGGGKLIYHLAEESIEIPLFFSSISNTLSASVTLEYTASEWWSYGETWDTATGKPL